MQPNIPIVGNYPKLGSTFPVAESLPSHKKTHSIVKSSNALPFGKIPILEVDGLNLHQSLAIARYLTRNTDLAGKTDLEQCQVDAIVDTLDDFMSCFPWAEKKQDVKDQMFKELLTCDAPHLLQDLDTYLGEKEWFIGNSVTWADFYWEICSTTLLVFKPDLLDIHPRLVTL
uniref:glutathione transferase n=1 Tax=Camelus bactrianus TaxID=9837 RepID=A0A9W3G3H6_CAMBA|nr:hematopoietic prostaglandin D synthase [Camelus bactrianus]